VKLTIKKPIPWITAIVCAVCIVLFIGINTEKDLDTWERYAKWGSYPTEEIWNGKLWGLITSNFLHVEFWHLIFNLFWFWDFGKKMEFGTSKKFYLLFILSASIISSAFEIIFAGESGIGLSGVVYAQFGFIYLSSKKSAYYKGLLAKTVTKLFVVWIPLGIVLTKFKIFNVGNAAHIGGLLWGLLLAYCLTKEKKLIKVALPAYSFLLVCAISFWQPFGSLSELQSKAYKLHSEGKYDEAEKAYLEILKRDEDNVFAKENLKQIKIEKLSKKAYDLHEHENYSEAAKCYKKILKLDPTNKWAQENMQLIPIIYQR
jgi:membrane associated rhomboid family serine protease